MRRMRLVALLGTLTVASASTASAQLLEDFNAPFPAWETGWFGTNSDATNYYCARPCANRGNNPTGIWLGGIGGPTSSTPIQVNFTPSFGSTIGSLSIDIGAFGGNNFYVLDSFGNTIFNQAVPGTTFGANGPIYNTSFIVTSTTGIGAFGFSGAGSSGNTAVDNIGVDLVTTAAPEPATLALVASGIALVGATARRRRRTA
jgi:hypothetical protein